MRSGYGARVRALSSFYDLCASLFAGDFGGYNALDAFAMVETVTAEEVRSFLAETLTPERCAMSVIVPLPAEPAERDARIAPPDAPVGNAVPGVPQDKEASDDA